MCYWPELHHNPKYKENKKNGGIIPPFHDERVLRVAVGCGKCKECLNAKKRNWQVRLLEDIKHNKNGKFVTLTLSNEWYTKLSQWPPSIKFPDITLLKGYDLDNQIATIAQYHFNENWRKEFGKALRHFYVTELGHQGTENIHLHGIVWTNQTYQTIQRKWQYGYIWPKDDKDIERAYVGQETINYIIKYITKRDELHKTYEPKILTSAGIGKDYIYSMAATTNYFNEEATREYYRTETGHKIGMPIYWRNKLYTDEQREKLWIHKLNQQVRYVNGNKIDISKNEKTYYKILETARQKNEQLGYGNNKRKWKLEEYEQMRRIMKQNERIEAAKVKAGVINTIRTKNEN